MFYKKLKIIILFIFLLSHFCFGIDSTTEVELMNIFENIPKMFLGKNIAHYPEFRKRIRYEHFDYNTNMEVYKAIGLEGELYYYIQNDIICGVETYIREKTVSEAKEDIKLIKKFCLKYSYIFENEFKDEKCNYCLYSKNNISVYIVTYNDDQKFFRLLFGKMKD